MSDQYVGAVAYHSLDGGVWTKAFVDITDAVIPTEGWPPVRGNATACGADSGQWVAAQTPSATDLSAVNPDTGQEVVIYEDEPDHGTVLLLRRTNEARGLTIIEDELYHFVIEQGGGGPDLNPPVFSNLSPPDGAVEVPVGAAVSFHVEDDPMQPSSGVDPASITLRYRHPGCVTWVDVSASLVKTPSGNGYDCSYQHPTGWPEAVTVMLWARAQDYAGNQGSALWHFTTEGAGGDNTPPPPVSNFRVTGVGPETGEGASDGWVSLSWGNPALDFDHVVMAWKQGETQPTGRPPELHGPQYQVGDQIGDMTVVYVGVGESFVVTGLEADWHWFAIWVADAAA